MIGRILQQWFPVKQEPDWNARLLADVEKRLASFELKDWKRRRAAALKGRRKG